MKELWEWFTSYKYQEERRNMLNTLFQLSVIGVIIGWLIPVRNKTKFIRKR